MRFIAAFVFLILGHAAYAETPAPIDMTTVITDLQGKPIPDPSQREGEDCSKCGPLTLGSAIAASMCGDLRETANESALEKARRCKFGMKLMDQKAATLTAPEVAKIEANIKGWPAMVVLRIIPLIDPNQRLDKD